MKVAVFSILLFMSMTIHCDASRKLSKVGAAKNITPLKSIKSPDGDIIDCVGIYEQPAFDHPLLKDHIILMDPSYRPEGFSGTTNPVTQLWNLKESCPEGTIPIRRTTPTVNNIKKQPRIFSQSSSSLNSTIDQLFGIHEHSVAYVKNNRKYHGTMASISVWRPEVQVATEFSLAQVWLVAGQDSGAANTLEAGWQVYSGFYGDNNPRLFIFATTDGYHSGCYNLLCPGFVQTSNKVALGASISPVSTYHGRLYEVDIQIWKDETQQAWWLRYQDINIGYWPASLFPFLSDAATMIEWGGEVYNTRTNGQHTTTQMGSGHFAEEGEQGASFIRNIMVIDESNHAAPPDDQLVVKIERPTCYNLIPKRNGPSGNFFFFGGPGRNPNCP